VEDAVQRTGADASIVFVPASSAADAILEASEAGIRLVVAITDGVPLRDSIRIQPVIRRRQTVLIGPNCPGVITPGQCKVGIMPAEAFAAGRVGVVSRSGTLTYEIVHALSEAGLGQSTCVGIGGDPVPGTSFLDILGMFEHDDETDAVVLIGEIGGSDEEQAAAYAERMSKRVVAFIGGRSAPAGKRMGHAGAIVSGRTGTAEMKVAAFRAAGVLVAEAVTDIPLLAREALASGPRKAH
jgi:succinyl-CoA synthetase alpha subunit